MKLCQVLELAGHIARHGATILDQCRGIPVAALRRYLTARKKQCTEWSHVLSQFDGEIRSGAPERWALFKPVLDEIAISGVLVRVASTALHGIGLQMDIPLAIDVAAQSHRQFEIVVQRAIGIVAVAHDPSIAQLMDLNRLGQMSDRLADLLCGSLLPAYRCERYAVDAGRAADFAQTFGKDPNLVRVPIQQAMLRLPDHTVSGCALEVERSLLACLPIVAGFAGPENQGPSQENRQPLRVVRAPASPDQPPGAIQPGNTFPSHSFARSRRRLLPGGTLPGQ